MWTDAILAYLHFTAIFVFFAFLSIETWLLRTPIDSARAAELALADRWYWGSFAAVVATGLARLFFGAKGMAFLMHGYGLPVKLLLVAAVAFLSLAPRSLFRRWSREAASNPQWTAPEPERLRARRRLMLVVHVASLVPLLAVMMTRALG
jgi:putative membrane protein